MSVAVLVPIPHGTGRMGVIELCARDETKPDEALEAALSAIAMQLGHVHHLMRAGETPRWRTGRM
jgi:hypothetical protein